MPERPEWLKVHVPTPAAAERMRVVRQVLAQHRLRTICQGALCPNAVECWSAGTATFMILGDICTRGCRFCAVKTGSPEGALDRGEPARVGAAVRDLKLQHVVLTSVDRDDLPDGGAAAFVETVLEIKRASPGSVVELLLPDFSGDPRWLLRVMACEADILGHNLETVARLTPALRDRRASYQQSLDVLQFLRTGARGRAIKSGLMLGLGERRSEIREALGDLHEAGTSWVTIGQYLPPTSSSAPLRRYVPPEEFREIEGEAREIGFSWVIAGPLVRSSYHAQVVYGAR
ncbi:MAG: lipoyl synthase [Candidatus Bipolaricaulota bacterium]|nr:lipoyl synthase [Candidatus Bipolaricaulota bacterium]